jgi:biopolymer transport protein ExbD
MKIASAAREDDIEINVIPLIDVMLTLLMFFVLTTTFENQTRMRISLPEASAKPVATSGGELIVQVDREGHYYVGSNEVLNPGLDTLREAVRQAGGADEGRRVLLRADGRATHQSVITAMDAISQAGFSNLSIATLRNEGD